MIRRLLAILVCLSPAAWASDGCMVPLDRSLTLRNRFPFLVEAEHGRMAAGESRLSFTLPMPVGAECHDRSPPPKLRFGDTADVGSDRIALRLLAGEEFRYDGDGVWSTEAGGVFSASKGPATAHLDARIFSESGGDPSRPSYDRESTDDQDGEVTGSVDYRSYVRFRGDMNLELPFGRFTAARDAAHWGPALYGNGVFSQEAVPFYQYVYAARIGPLSVTSLYGDLQVGADQNNASENRHSRNLFAHRYELALGKNWLVGLSEQLILHDLAKPYLFVPVFPLFIAKSLLVEDNSNGNLAVDAAWRMPWNGLLYAEFLLDDLESPSSMLLKDYVQNKWAVVAGAHLTRDIGTARTGLILEFSHVEPWVYSHFQPGTSQTANLGFPLGNPNGPDSRALVGKTYARFPNGAYLAVASGLFWKGHGPGADLEQPSPANPLAVKERLAGEGSPDVSVEPHASFNWKGIAAFLEARIGHGSRAAAGVRFFL